jgi:hypothetical protein
MNWKIVFVTPLTQSAPWLAMVLIVTWAGYPGVICVTPVAWLLATRVGLIIANRSSSDAVARRLQEAALGGAWLGLIEGILFIVMSPLIGPIQPDEQTNMILLTTCMVGMGIFIAAGLSVFTANLVERRRLK